MSKKEKRYLKHAEVSGRVFETKAKKETRLLKKKEKNKIRGRSSQEENYRCL